MVGAGAALALFSFSAQFHNRLNQDYNMGRKVALQTLGMAQHPTYVYKLDYFKAFEFFSDQAVLQVFPDRAAGARPAARAARGRQLLPADLCGQRRHPAQ